MQTLLTGNLPHDVRMARLDPSELKNASAQDIVSIVTGSDNWTSIFSCCKLKIGSNELPTEASKRLMHPDKWTIPALQEFMGGDVTLMATGFRPPPPEPEEPDEERRGKRNRQPQHSNLNKNSNRPKKYPPGHNPNKDYGYERDDGRDRPPEQPEPNQSCNLQHLRPPP